MGQMIHKRLIVTIPCEDETFNKVIELMQYETYNKIYWKAFIPPNTMEYTISYLSETGVENWKNKFRELFIDSKYKSYCSFKVEDMEKTP
jgi:hypothetical protein